MPCRKVSCCPAYLVSVRNQVSCRRQIDADNRSQRQHWRSLDVLPKMPNNEMKKNPHKQGNNTGNVGRSKPPKHTQWRPGQSGNPNGRPKKETCLTTLLKEELEKAVTDQNLLKSVDAKIGDITWAQMIAIALIRKAAKGNERAAEIIFDRAEGKVRPPLISQLTEARPVDYDYSRLTYQELRLLQNLIQKMTPVLPQDSEPG